MTTIYLIVKYVREKHSSMGKCLGNEQGFYTSKDAIVEDIDKLRTKNPSVLYMVETHKAV